VAAVLDLKVKTGSNCRTDVQYEFLDPQHYRTIIINCNFSETRKKVIFEVADSGHFGFLPPTTSVHTFESDTLSYPFLTSKEDQNTEKRTFAFHSHGSASDDPTIGLIPRQV